MTNELKVGLHGPTGNNLRPVRELNIHLIVPNRNGHACEQDVVSVEPLNAVGKPGVDHTCAESVIRPIGNHAGEYDTAVDVSIDKIAVGRANRDPAEYRNSALRVTILRSVELLVDHRIKAGITRTLDRYSRAIRIGQ